MPDTINYYVSPADPLHSRCWDGQCVIYHAGSGDTHLLSRVDMAVLECIGKQPVSCDSLSTKFEHILGDQAAQYIGTLLARFEMLGLVETV